MRIESDGGGDGGVAYCIDTTEVTNADYQEFLAAAVTPASLQLPMPACQGQNDFIPRDGNGNAVALVPGQENFPVDQVNWCDAYAYCTWAGKRLCGQIGGGPLAEGATEMNASLAQWYAACSRGGSRVYPYGDTFDTTTCGGGGAGAGSPIGPVAQRSGCVGAIRASTT